VVEFYVDMKSPTINPQTRISELIKANPLVIDTLVELNPNFNKLRNPILRNLLARRVSISNACAIAGCKVSDFMDRLKSIGFNTEGDGDASVSNEDDPITAAVFTGGLGVVELDVRPVLAAGSDPLKLILKASKALKGEECLKIINTFEPVPLISLLRKEGFRSWSERPEKDMVYTWFVKDESVHIKPEIRTAETDFSNDGIEFDRMMDFFGPERIRTIDVRDMEMPQPMITILTNLADLRDDEALFVYHKKVPVYLLPELRERGFKYLIRNSPDGKINMLISKV